MNNQGNEKNELHEVQFVIDASHEVIDSNFQNAISKMRAGIEASLFETDKAIDSRKLLQALVFLLAAVEERFKTISPELSAAKQETEPQVNKCSFCGRTSSESKLIVVGAYGSICDSCIRDAYQNLEKHQK